jgi:hypothetical protein
MIITGAGLIQISLPNNSIATQTWGFFLNGALGGGTVSISERIQTGGLRMSNAGTPAVEVYTDTRATTTGTLLFADAGAWTY